MSLWVNMQRSLPVVKGNETPLDERDAWEWLRNPLPPGDEEPLVANLRLQLGIPDRAFFSDKGFGSLEFFAQQSVLQTLEEAGLLERVAVGVHPVPDASSTAYPGVRFDGLGLLTNHPFGLAYQAAEDFTTALQQRPSAAKAAGFMKSLLLQRICSAKT